jgi:hypothetical protein
MHKKRTRYTDAVMSPLPPFKLGNFETEGTTRKSDILGCRQGRDCIGFLYAFQNVKEENEVL